MEYNVESMAAGLTQRLGEIKAVLQSSMDRTWEDESLYTVAQIAANAISWRNREISRLEEELANQKKAYGLLHQEKEILQRSMPVGTSKVGYVGPMKSPTDSAREPWDTDDARIRRYAYGVGLKDGLNARK